MKMAQTSSSPAQNVSEDFAFFAPEEQPDESHVLPSEVFEFDGFQSGAEPLFGGDVEASDENGNAAVDLGFFNFTADASTDVPAPVDFSDFSFDQPSPTKKPATATAHLSSQPEQTTLQSAAPAQRSVTMPPPSPRIFVSGKPSLPRSVSRDPPAPPKLAAASPAPKSVAKPREVLLPRIDALLAEVAKEAFEETSFGTISEEADIVAFTSRVNAIKRDLKSLSQQNGEGAGRLAAGAVKCVEALGANTAFSQLIAGPVNEQEVRPVIYSQSNLLELLSQLAAA